MTQSFYFYDLETSGISARHSRIMQFAGQRTDMQLKPIGQPDNYLIKLAPDILPDPEAILITKISPQKTQQDGISEAEFLKIFYKDIVRAGTIFVGFNNIRFDDEFMRFLHYRNFYDAYEWQWADDNSRWDILDVSRMTRALRPEGLKWPFDESGKPTNRLEALSKVNSIDHGSAHDALHDVRATIAVAGMIREKQPKLFEYLLRMRNKKQVSELVEQGLPFVYASGRYESQYLKTTVAVKLCDAPGTGGVLVYDLRYDPDEITKLKIDELSERFYVAWGSEVEPLPIKVLSYNKSPAVAPLSTLNKESSERIKIDLGLVKDNFKKLKQATDFADKVREAYDRQRPKDENTGDINLLNVDEKLYSGFVGDSDKTKMRVVRAANADELADLHLDFADKRLELLLTLYKGRNFPKSLSASEQSLWEQYLKNKLLSDRPSPAEKFFSRLEEISKRSGLSDEDRYILTELELYGESLLPSD